MEDRLQLKYIVPRIYVHLPSSGNADVTLGPEDSPVVNPLAADLDVLYAYDLGPCFQILSARGLAALGLTLEELHQAALENLRALNLDIQAHGDELSGVIIAGGNYEASLILLPELWDKIESVVKGNLVVSVPARDMVLFAGDAKQENLAQLRRITSRALEQMAKPLSPQFPNAHGERLDALRGLCGLSCPYFPFLLRC